MSLVWRMPRPCHAGMVGAGAWDKCVIHRIISALGHLFHYAGQLRRPAGYNSFVGYREISRCVLYSSNLRLVNLMKLLPSSFKHDSFPRLNQRSRQLTNLLACVVLRRCAGTAKGGELEGGCRDAWLQTCTCHSSSYNQSSLYFNWDVLCSRTGEVVATRSILSISLHSQLWPFQHPSRRPRSLKPRSHYHKPDHLLACNHSHNLGFGFHQTRKQSTTAI
jgi:hypothetical protein